MEKNEKIAYNKLISRKNTMLFAFPPIGLFAWVYFAYFFDVTNPVIMIVIGVVISGLADTWFRKINICPFCKNPFFYREKMVHEILALTYLHKPNALTAVSQMMKLSFFGQEMILS
ncbi:hypothetical protein [Moraxella sp.]|uniref:hypothetical protein n=1 Tax=Moraxella sp. TaxID=479 RepID=UPI0026DBEA64|nr:hypothetical protein [Moraxella sp.]MDO4895327.1 hypothetical protein [Moraxella sp.]